jgi:hypothetical protein
MAGREFLALSKAFSERFNIRGDALSGISPDASNNRVI